MERKQLLFFLSAMFALCTTAPILLGQEQAQGQATSPRLRGYFTVRKPAQGIDIDTIKEEMAKSTTLPLWTFDRLFLERWKFLSWCDGRSRSV